MCPMTTQQKVREISARRAAERQGLFLSRSSRKDNRAPDYGRYRLIPADAPRRKGSGPEYTLTLDDVEAHLTGRTPEPDVRHPVVCYSWDD